MESYKEIYNNYNIFLTSNGKETYITYIDKTPIDKKDFDFQVSNDEFLIDLDLDSKKNGKDRKTLIKEGVNKLKGLLEKRNYLHSVPRNDSDIFDENYDNIIEKNLNKQPDSEQQPDSPQQRDSEQQLDLNQQRTSESQEQRGNFMGGKPNKYIKTKKYNGGYRLRRSKKNRK
jgi:hypothetical protein